MFDRQSQQAMRRRAFFDTELSQRLSRGWVDVAGREGRVVGAALWQPPTISTPSNVPYLIRAPLIVATFGRRLQLAGELLSAILQHHPRTPHWYLACIGVDPDHQGLGIAGALMRSGLTRADLGRMPAYLESSKPANVPVYEHFGFAAEDPIDGPEGAPPLIPMWRPATR